ncbi:DUF429 domain-containing protein [Arthrobacter sp. M4]|uniref:DUF429 domain-containing protein n=1 Tax=Arthrobacter sp. M4 TaxID=218160 RepID=UPI001CDC0CA1|nr:DUF429 domain-containing protein [Arthrobacter sp. M4]MCA4134260.1 DUF429 domain-containing protein [Arthrobacter sp. M4]
MRTLGVDLAADPKRTAAAVIEWLDGAARLVHLSLGVTDGEIVDLFAETDLTGIDCPLGWPRAFLTFLQGHAVADPAALLRHDGLAGRRELVYRVTDLFVMARTGLIPLSVSADRLAHPAMRCAVIQAKIAQRWGAQSRDGSDRLAEVYPAASLKVWGMPPRRYKGAAASETAQRVSILRKLAETAPWLNLLEHQDRLIASDDMLDAVVASLTARAAALHATLPPDPEHRGEAREEGWMHVPTGSLTELIKPQPL